MAQPEHTEIEPESDDEQVDPEYTKITAQGLLELEAERQAKEERRRASAPPPDTRTPEEKAEHLRAFAGGAFLHGAFRSGGGPVFDVPTFKAYLDDYLRRAGATGDPVEEMLLQQLAQAHFAIGRLHVGASASKDTGEASAYIAATARLMAEYRKSTLALQEYRLRAAKLAESDERKAAGAEKAGRRRKGAANGAKNRRDSEVGSNLKHRLSEYFNEAQELEPALT